MDDKAISEMSEQELRDHKALRPESEDELRDYIRQLVDREHDYGTCVYAMSLAAVAAFNYVAGKLGVTGFQASCADLDILRRTRHMENGFRILNYDNLLYPQYLNSDYFPSAADLIEENKKQLSEAAKKRLDEPGEMHERVRRHLEYLARLS